MPPRRHLRHLLAAAAIHSAAAAAGSDLTALSLEELMNIEVTTVAKRSQRLGDTAAAVFVITPEDIRRSGATVLPEVLRMVPGLDVARIDTNKWAISARGFNNRFANKLLVLVDGRSVYTPQFSGVFWDVQSVPLEEVERIEVIRGPGAALWGANAVDGVINVITRSAADSRGGLVTAAAGTWQQTSGYARYGGAIGESGHYRVYAEGAGWGNARYDDNGAPAADDWGMRQGGFRADWGASGERFTLQGDLYDGHTGQEVTAVQLTPPYTPTVADKALSQGGNLLARWERPTAGGGELRVQAYFDHTRRVSLFSCWPALMTSVLAGSGWSCICKKL